MGMDDKGMSNVQHIQHTVMVGNGETLTATKMGNKHITVIQSDGTKINLTLKDYKYVPGLWYNLLSITKVLQSHWQVGSIGTTLFIKKQKMQITFDKKIKTGSGQVVGCIAIPRAQHSVSIAAPALLENGREININKFHCIMGHPSDHSTVLTAQYYGIKLTGESTTCEDCALAEQTAKCA
jgi:hypothetical protein